MDDRHHHRFQGIPNPPTEDFEESSNAADKPGVLHLLLKLDAILVDPLEKLHHLKGAHFLKVAVPAQFGLEEHLVMEKVEVEVQQVQLFRLFGQHSFTNLFELSLHPSQKGNQFCIFVLLWPDFVVELLQALLQLLAVEFS